MDIDYTDIQCDFCDGGYLNNVRLIEKYVHEGKTYIFENAPVGLCRKCGERYIHGQVLKAMQERIHESDNVQFVPFWTGTDLLGKALPGR